LVDIARAQDAEVGDGTTSVVSLRRGTPLFVGGVDGDCELVDALDGESGGGAVALGVSPHVIIKGYRTAARLAIERVNQLAVTVNAADSGSAWTTWRSRRT
jgi:T-complex protein 1 subunit eta